MNNFSPTLSSPIITKESCIKKYLACLSGISKGETINRRFKIIKRLIYTHAFYNSHNPAFNINFLYQINPNINGDWYKYVLTDDFSATIKCFWDYLVKEEYSSINLNSNDDTNSFIDKYFNASALENPAFNWNLPQNFMPFFCAFFSSLYKHYTKKKFSFSTEIFFNTMRNFLEDNPALKYAETDSAKLLVELQTSCTTEGYIIYQYAINISKETFMKHYEKWLTEVFPSQFKS